MKSPCSTCTRVKDPRNCENKQCSTWRTWFLERWNEIRAYALAKGGQTDDQTLGRGVLS